MQQALHSSPVYLVSNTERNQWVGLLIDVHVVFNNGGQHWFIFPYFNTWNIAVAIIRCCKMILNTWQNIFSFLASLAIKTKGFISLFSRWVAPRNDFSNSNKFTIPAMNSHLPYGWLMVAFVNAQKICSLVSKIFAFIRFPPISWAWAWAHSTFRFSITLGLNVVRISKTLLLHRS